MIPEVTVDESYKQRRYDHGDCIYVGGGRYVVAKVDGRLVLWATDAVAERHANLLAALKDATPESRVVCWGGGMLYVAEADRKLYIWDYSADYGHDDKEETAALLQQAFPDFVIIVDRDPKEDYLQDQD